ncbi:MAG: alpha-N-arabinofuranosidase [Bifidobacteriaceae bacterium]|jgi:alpha-N-arabinofuranosidase|nr:alpha-N-arabinofuranosidase [Bifidobacteriaceae bacterium]
MHHATITVDPAFVVGPVRRQTFGSFVEHMGRCVYTGIYEPDHPTAVAGGFRGDVLELTRELGVSTIRYPGGNFVSSYRWEDGVGPQETRPVRLSLAWHSMEPNTVGVDEFMAWCRLAGIEPMLAVNLGTRGLEEALDLLEYCNFPGGTELSERRRANGSDEPHNVRLWCLGNEMDGPWQTGHKTAHEYGRLAAETARAMRQLDPDLKLVACGSSSSTMETFAAWENAVLTEAYDVVDMISAHAYYCPWGGDMASFLASAVNMDYFIDSVVATADSVRAALKRTKRINISFDEWNVWYMEDMAAPTGSDWPFAPVLIEDRYSVADAVVVGSLLISLLRHTDRVEAASLAQLVNVIAPIMTEPGGRAWRQTIFHPFALTSRYAAGDVLRPAVQSSVVATQQFGDIPAVDAVATLAPGRTKSAPKQVALFLVNRSLEEEAAVRVSFKAIPGLHLTEAVTYAHDDPNWKASADDADTVLPQPNQTASLADGVLKLTLPPVSWSMVRLG